MPDAATELRCEHCKGPMPPKSKYAPKQARFCKDRCRTKHRYKLGPTGCRKCRKCGVEFKPKGAALDCPLHMKTRARPAQYGHLSEDDIIALYRPNPCASCVHSKRSADAASGYLCTLDLAFQCSPWSAARLHKERQNGEQTECYAS